MDGLMLHTGPAIEMVVVELTLDSSEGGGG
jgi:hypothetical protein